MPSLATSALKFQSIIRTRDRNKTVHPGEPDQVAKRRSQAEVEEERTQKATEKANEAKRQKLAFAKAAQIEDELQADEVAREKAAKEAKTLIAPFRPKISPPWANPLPVVGKDNTEEHPLEKERRTRGSKKIYAVEEEGSEGNETHDDYQPQDIESEDSLSIYGDHVEENSAAVRGKPKKPNRDDITAARQTKHHRSSSSTTPKVEHNGESSVKRPVTKKGHREPSGLLPGWKPTQAIPKSGSAGSIRPDDDSAVRYGGLVGDDEDDDVEAAGVSKVTNGTARKSLANSSMIRITEGPKPSREPTKKELRGGANKWQLKHLPERADPDAFTSMVTPLAKIKAGTLDPWASLSVPQIQEIVDDVYGPGRFSVDDEDVWCGLISYRLQNWRNAFATVAMNAVRAHIEESNMTEDEIAEAVEVFLTPDGTPPTTPYFWRDWNVTDDGNVKKSGRCQNGFVLYTFGMAHLVEYEDIPCADKLYDDEIPIGALILAHQAVEHAFKMWKTGVFIAPESRKPAGQFSYDNYADYIQHVKPTAGLSSAKSRNLKVLKRRATQHVATVKSLSRDTWDTIFSEASSHISKGKKRKRSQSESSRGSDVVGDLVQEDENYEEVVLESD